MLVWLGQKLEGTIDIHVCGRFHSSSQTQCSPTVLLQHTSTGQNISLFISIFSCYRPTASHHYNFLGENRQGTHEMTRLTNIIELSPTLLGLFCDQHVIKLSNF